MAELVNLETKKRARNSALFICVSPTGHTDLIVRPLDRTDYWNGDVNLAFISRHDEGM